MNSKISAFTIIASNYIQQASILIDSYHKFHPDHNFFLIFIDDKKKNVKDATSINASEINNIHNLNEIRFKYDITEYSTCLKPYVAEYILIKYKSEKILYIDPDICFYNKIDFIIKKLDAYECVLIPHITKPYEDKLNPTETDISKVGFYNLGFAAFKNNKNTIKFLHWWQDKLNLFCYNNPEEDMFTDQKWMDFAPSYLDTYVIREKGYDVAYWNLHEYIGIFPVSKIIFFHFSGFVLNDDYISKYQNRFKLKDIKEYKLLFDEYSQKMRSSTTQIVNNYKYPYNYFSNGDYISTTIKRMYGQLKKENLKKIYKDPFNISPSNSFYNYLLSDRNRYKILNFVIDLFYSKKILQSEFPHLEFYQNNLEYKEYILWLITFGEKEYGLPKKFLDEIIKNSKMGSAKKIGLISLIEQIKKRYSGMLFIQKIYNVLMRRQPDDLGLTVNLEDIRRSSFYKNRVIYRLINSSEFKRKNNSSLQLRIYVLFLVLITYIHKTFEFLNEFFFSKKNNFEKGVNIFGYLDTDSGVGESARGIVRAFQNVDIPISIINIEQPWLKRDNKEFSQYFTKKCNYPINIVCVNADQVEHIVDNQLSNDLSKNKYNIGYWYWESDIFPDRYKNAFRYFDEIWVASEYVKKSLKKISPIPIFVIPPLLIKEDIEIFDLFDYKKHGLKIGFEDFVFLNIFDSASFWERKNPFGLIKSFKKAFHNKAKIKLIIKTTEIHKSKIYPRLLKEINNSRNIFLLDKYLPKSEINKLENQVNCYISLHRSEGLGIPLIESMILKKPVIATNFGGNVDFMSSDFSFPVRFQLEKLEHPIGPYPKNSSWAIPDINHAATIMKFVYEKQKEANKIAEKGSQKIIRFYSPEKIGELIKSRLLEFGY